jgi:hypothetical protein
MDYGARYYDPQLGRWHTPDPANQFGSPYVGLGNNPVNGTDPDGKFFGTVFTAFWDAVVTLFTGGLNFNNGISGRAWAKYDPTTPGSKTNNAFRIDMGLFQTDPNRTIAGRAWQLISRFTWEQPMTGLGNAFAHSVNWTGDVERVDYFAGATVLWNANNTDGGTTVGSYINIRSWDDDARTRRSPGFVGEFDELLVHEYGHYMQARTVGGVLTILGGANSGLAYVVPWANPLTSWWEQDASQRGINYMIRTGRVDPNTAQGRANLDFYYRQNPSSLGAWWEFATLPFTFFWRF